MNFLYLVVALQTVGFAVITWALYSRIEGLEDLVAELSKRPVLPAEVAAETQVSEWLRGYEEAPEGSPRREAYAARLRSVGAL